MSRAKLTGIFVVVLAMEWAGELRADGASLDASVASTPERGANGIRLDSLEIPATIAGSKTFTLEAIVVRPDDGAPHPLALINHGSPRDSEDRATMSPYRMWAQAMVFARRGWVAVAILRRGYGQSQGAWAEGFGSCANPDYLRAGRAGAADIAAAAKFLLTQSYVTKDKWISVGHSAGGFATVALTADPPPALAAAIVFAPGRGSTEPDQVCGETQEIATFAELGKTSRTPVLWISAPNDHFFGPRLVPQFTRAFSNAGGHLSFVETPAFGEDGHQLFTTPSGMAVWSPLVDRFLAANHLVLRDHPIDIPLPDLAPPPSLGAKGREAFKNYLASGPNKAFAISGSSFGWVSGRRSADEAVDDALGNCTPGKGGECAIVNINDKPAE
jgi:dienelactone hydrolase